MCGDQIWIMEENKEIKAETESPAEKPKKKRKFGDNWLVLGIKAEVLMVIGEMLTGVLIGMLMFVPLILSQSITDMDVVMELASNSEYTSSDWINTAIMYFEFIGTWAIFLLWFLIRKNNRPLFRAIGTGTGGNNWKKLLLGFGIGFVMNGLCILLAWLHGDFKLHFSRFDILPLLIIFICVFIQSSAEELVCRCYYYQRLMKSYRNPLVAIGVSSAFFAALHLANDGVGVLPIIDIAATGVLFCMIVYYLDSFWCACAVHCAWNYTQNIIFGLPNSGTMVPYSIMTMDTSSAKSSFFYNTGFGVEGSVMSILVQIAACVLIYLWARKHPSQPTDIWAQNGEEKQ